MKKFNDNINKDIHLDENDTNLKTKKIQISFSFTFELNSDFKKEFLIFGKFFLLRFIM